MGGQILKSAMMAVDEINNQTEPRFSIAVISS